MSAVVNRNADALLRRVVVEDRRVARVAVVAKDQRLRAHLSLVRGPRLYQLAADGGRAD